MQSDSFKDFQDRIFQELEEKQELATRNVVMGLVELAAKAGLTVDDLLQMLDSGKSPTELVEAVSARVANSRGLY